MFTTALRLIPFLIIGVVISLYYGQPSLLETFEARTYDLRLRSWRGPVAPTGAVAIVAIDDKSIAELGRFPWSRQVFADLIDRLTAAGVRGIAVDVLFPETEAPATDAALAEAIARSGVTSLAGAFIFSPVGGPNTFLDSIPPIRQAAGPPSHLNVFPDDDGVVRWTRPAIPLNGELVPSLGLAAALFGFGEGTFEVGPYFLRAGPATAPLDAEDRLLINFRGPPGTFEQFSLVDVLRDRVPAEALRGKTIVVGPTAIGIYDLRVTPFSSNTPGVEVNANVADNLLRGDFIRRGGFEALIDLAAIVCCGLLVAVLAHRVRAAIGFPLVVAVSLGYLWFACAQVAAGRWLSIVYPLLSILLVYSTASYLRFFLLDRRSKQVRAMFSCYVSRKIVDQLVKNPELARVGGDSKIVTILFADVKGYTSYSEKRSPREVVRILNEYLAEMTDVIHEFDGTLDKFMGDGILAYWGAPLPQPNHAEQAVRCALEMLRRLGGLHAKWRREGTEPLDCGIGIHTGEVIAGNIGAEGKKMEYTVIGDAVNLTYRIQGESRRVNGPLISEALFAEVRDLVVAEPIGPFLVKGKEHPVNALVLRGMKGEPAIDDIAVPQGGMAAVSGRK